MYCNGCGQALVAGQGFCPRCGRASGWGMPMVAGAPIPAFWPPLAQIEQRVNSLAVGWFVYAALVGITGVIGLAFAHAFLSGHEFGPWYSHSHRLFDGPMMPLFLLKFARIALCIRLGLALAAGYGLYNKTTWGRTVAIIAGCLAILHPFLGTALGIWTLVVLLKAPNAAGYEALAR